MKRAFTLLETLITMAVVALVFGCFMLLLRDSMVLSRRTAAKEEGIRVIQIGLDRILTEAREANQFVGVGTSAASASPQFEMYKVTTPDESRFPLAPPAFPTPQASRWLTPWLAHHHPEVLLWMAAGAFQPLADDQMSRVRYRLDQSELIRESGPKAGAFTHRLSLARGLSGFRCWRDPGPLLSAEVTWLDAGRVHTVSGQVFCPCLERNGS